MHSGRLVACIVYSAKSFIWSVMFVFLLVYIYGLYLTQSVHLHRLETGKNAAGDEVLAEYFGTVGRSILSLFQALTGGIDWRDLVEPLSEYMNWGWGLATVIWIAFLMLGVMNIITGNFVSAAMERSQSVKDVDNVFQARRLFKSLDIDDNGAITIDEIRRHLESKPVQHFFRTIDVDSSEAEVLFEILDLSGDGSIDKEEFISGCLRLQGAARAVDLLLMTKDTRRGFEQILIYLEELTSRLDATQEFLELVKETCDDYAEISEIVDRHNTLESANADLSEMQIESETKIEELRGEFQTYKKDQEMEMMELRNKVALLQIELDECQKKRQQLQHDFDEATQEDSRHSLKFGQILMSVENLFLRCTTKRKNIQHAQTPVDDEGKQEGEEGQDESKDSFRKKKENAIRQLKVILAYLKDFKEICEILRKERRADPTRGKQAGALEAVTAQEPNIRFEAEMPKGGDRTSQNSGSQGNTKELRPSANVSTTQDF
ncbi:unnamed protein product [Durusdinium trenchii]|uniref:EF-hand domain-containing protein n=1 Tax=Durusdinium trenchii TaxID=1381693 RepID=A0ABP0P5G0_9DINO